MTWELHNIHNRIDYLNRKKEEKNKVEKDKTAEELLQMSEADLFLELDKLIDKTCEEVYAGKKTREKAAEELNLPLEIFEGLMVDLTKGAIGNLK